MLPLPLRAGFFDIGHFIEIYLENNGMSFDNAIVMKRICQAYHRFITIDNIRKYLADDEDPNMIHPADLWDRMTRHDRNLIVRGLIMSKAENKLWW